MFVADSVMVYKSIFGQAVHCASYNEGNVAIYTFDTPQTPADLGPLVRVELIPNP